MLLGGWVLWVCPTPDVALIEVSFLPALAILNGVGFCSSTRGSCSPCTVLAGDLAGWGTRARKPVRYAVRSVATLAGSSSRRVPTTASWCR